MTEEYRIADASKTIDHIAEVGKKDDHIREATKKVGDGK